MKRFLLLSLAFIFALNLFAQHISFMGIQLGQPVSNIDRMLVNKGFVFKRMIDDVRKSYDGNFWIYNKVNLSYYVDNGIVTTIYLSPVLGTFDKMSDYNNLVYNLDSKLMAGPVINISIPLGGLIVDKDAQGMLISLGIKICR